MRLTEKRFFLGAAILGLVVAAVTFLGAFYLAAFKENSQVWERTDPYIRTEQMLTEAGPTPEVGKLLKQFPHPPGWQATIVTETLPSGDPVATWQTILAADPPGLAGTTIATGVIKRQQGRPLEVFSGAPIHGPDGKLYTVSVYQTIDFRLSLNLAMVVGVAVAWLALAFWLLADALDRTPAAPAWFFLSLLTGPLGLAVWLIVRPERRQEPQPSPGLWEAAANVCPGCGADLIPGAVFCVRCGFALHPACPECRRKVEPEWTYCGACGAPLNEGPVRKEA